MVSFIVMMGLAARLSTANPLSLAAAEQRLASTISDWEIGEAPIAGTHDLAAASQGGARVVREISLYTGQRETFVRFPQRER
jgi:hypothetical protein